MSEDLIPNPLWHRNISFAKSGLRIVAGLFMVVTQSVILAGVFLILAEVLGVVEEIV